METIGERIRNARKRLHMTQGALALAIGKHPNLLARWERGEVKMRAEVISDIAQVLCVSPAELIGNGGQETNSSDENVPNMSYWGEVVDAADLVAGRGNKRELSRIEPLLRDAYETILNALRGEEELSSAEKVVQQAGISQNNVGRDATINFGTMAGSTA